MPNSITNPDNQDPNLQEEMMRQIMQEAKEQKALEDSALATLAKEIEGKFNTDAGQRQRKEGEWYWAERLQLGSMWRYWNRWSTENSDNPFDVRDTDYVYADKPEFNIVKPKMKIGQAQLEMLQFGTGTDKNFTIKAKKPAKTQSQLANQSPVFQADGQTPMLDPTTGQPMTVGQLAMKASQDDDNKARMMDEQCWSQMEGAKYGEKMRQGFQDMLWYGSAIYKGPFNNNKCKRVRYQTQSSSGKPLWVTAFSEEPSPDFERVNPWLFYPDHRALCIEEAEHAAVVHIYTPTQLRKLVNQQGFRQDTIALLLKQTPRSNYYQAFRARAIQYNNSQFLDNKYVVLEWHGTVGKDSLKRLNIDPPYDNPFDMYKAEIWVCQGEVIYATLEMLESDTVVPFAVNTWEPDPASLFGFGAILLRDAQRVVNMTYQMVLDNGGLSAGPMVVMDKEAIKPIDGKPEIMPRKVWYFTENGGGMNAAQAIQFVNIPNNTPELMQILSMARDFGNEESIIPLISGGMEDPTVNDGGATGMTLRMQSSTTVLSSKARQWDDNVTKPIVSWFYEWNMQYNDNNDIKGDYNIDVQTSTAYLNKIMGQRDLERLSQQAAQDPDMKLLVDRSEILRAQVSGMNIPVDSIVRSNEEVKMLQQQQAQAAASQPPNPEVIKAQADMINAQAKQASVQNDAAQLQFDKDQGMQEAQMIMKQHQDDVQTRNNEAQARALDASSNRDVAMATLAGQNAQASNKLMTQLHIKEQEQQTKQFLGGIAAHQQQQKLGLEDRNTVVKERQQSHVEKVKVVKPK